MPEGDQRAAEVRHIRLAATPGDRRFAIVFVATSLSCCAAAVLLSILVDPLASWGTRLVPPLVPNDRDEKAFAYQRLSPRPAAIILGSSRVMKVRPACLELILGVPAFNFGVNSARAEDYLAILRFAQSQGPVRRVLIGVDPEALHSAVGSDHRLLASHALAPFVDPRLQAPTPVRLYRKGIEALSTEALTASLRSIKFVVTGRRPEPAYVCDSTGLAHVPGSEREVREGRYDQAAHLEGSVAEYRSRYRGFDALSEPRVAILTKMVETARAAGAQVDAYIPPLHPALERAMAQTSLPARTRDTEDVLSDLERRGLLRFVRLPTLASWGGDPALYFDGAHMMEANARRVLRAVYGVRAACAVQ